MGLATEERCLGRVFVEWGSIFRGKKRNQGDALGGPNKQKGISLGGDMNFGRVACEGEGCEELGSVEGFDLRPWDRCIFPGGKIAALEIRKREYEKLRGTNRGINRVKKRNFIQKSHP